MINNILHGKTALITGASSGLGVDFARLLAERGCHLVLVARREERLKAVQHELVERYGVRVAVIPMDLTAENAPQDLYDQMRTSSVVVDVLINNAGYGLFGAFIDIPWTRQANMLELDIITLTHLSQLFVTDMVQRNFGYILQVSSNGAFQPTPTYATYAAAKSYVLSFSEALSYELRDTNVRCTAVAPGITATEFLSVSGQRPSLYQRLVLMKSEEVAQIGIDAMLQGKASVVPGWHNALAAWSNRLIPRRLQAAIAYRAMTMR